MNNSYYAYFLDLVFSDILYLFVSLENRNFKRTKDVEKNKEEEHFPLISRNQHDSKSGVEGIELKKIFFLNKP